MPQNEERLMTASSRADDENLDTSLRPHSLREYVGQEDIKKSLGIYMTAALQRHEALDHVLLYGPPGLGKTTLACIIAQEMGASIRITSGPAIERPGDLASILTNLNQGDVLFIDEIHRLSRAVEEVLYPAMEDYTLDIMIGKGPTARSMRLPLQKFTLVGATTRSGSLSAPLRDRFGITYRLEMYTPEQLARIAARSASLLNINFDDEGIMEIARRSRGTPRIVNRMVKRVRDFAQIKGGGRITLEVACQSLNMLEVDDLGLDKVDRTMLETIATKFGGGPVGLDTLAATTGEDPITIEDVYEPYLMQLGFLMRTRQGRVITPLAYEHIGLKVPETSSQKTQGDDLMQTSLLANDGQDAHT